MTAWDGTVLHCMPFCGRWGGGRERLPIDAVIRPIHGRVKVVSLRHACLAAGLLEDVRKGVSVNWHVLGKLAEKKWDSSVERFLADARRAGATIEAADAQAAALRGAVIGWQSSVVSGTGSTLAVGICADLTQTIAILGRRVANMFVASRPPDYSWSALFGNALEFDDDLSDAPLLTDEPWRKFQWKSDNGKVAR